MSAFIANDVPACARSDRAIQNTEMIFALDIKPIGIEFIAGKVSQDFNKPQSSRQFI
jgi:hypothetical protein